MLAESVSNPRKSKWYAKLNLEFSRRRDRTVLSAREHRGPFCVQKPFYPADRVCHVYLLHPPGGMAGGDVLELDAQIKDGSNVLITTPSSAKFYRSDVDDSMQKQTLRVGKEASLEWLPMDTILFGGSRARIDTELHLDVDAAFIGWEALSLGRPTSGDHYQSGTLTQRTRIFVDSEAVLLERLDWSADDPVLQADWGLAGHTVWGMIYAYPADESTVMAIRNNQAVQNNAMIGVTLLGRLMVARCVSNTAQSLRLALEAGWKALRQPVIEREPIPPRIWMT